MIKEAICLRCSLKFSYNPNDGKLGKYCSFDCWTKPRTNTVCLNCNKQFEFLKMKSRELAKYCSVSCYNCVRRKHTIKEVFEKLVLKNDNGCWGWIGRLYSNGYTQITYLKKRYLGHRISYELYIGPIPFGKQVNHLCNNRICTAPLHLILGTHKENLDYMHQCGRANIGTLRPNSKLNEQQIREIKQQINENKTHYSISKNYNVEPATIRNIALGKSWKHVTLEDQ